MRSVPRRTFAAPLVAIACSGGGHEGSSFARLHRDGTACTLSRGVSGCPKGAMCNPPPPQPVECPAGMGKEEWAQIGSSKTKSGECVLIVSPCTDASCGTPTPCLDPAWGDPPLPALQWWITPVEGDTTCKATPAARTRFEANREPFVIACPPSLADRTGFIERSDPKAACFACTTMPCADPETAVAVDCPTAPSTSPSPAGTP
jgi:hypothetical protein